jgi:hypothetical protein
MEEGGKERKGRWEGRQGGNGPLSMRRPTEARTEFQRLGLWLWLRLGHTREREKERERERESVTWLCRRASDGGDQGLAMAGSHCKAAHTIVASGRRMGLAWDCRHGHGVRHV